MAIGELRWRKVARATSILFFIGAILALGGRDALVLNSVGIVTAKTWVQHGPGASAAALPGARYWAKGTTAGSCLMWWRVQSTGRAAEAVTTNLPCFDAYPEQKILAITMLGYRYLRLGDEVHAAEVLQETHQVALEPVIVEAAGTAMAGHRWAGAQALYALAVELNPSDANAYRQLAWAQAAQQDYASAADTLQKLARSGLQVTENDIGRLASYDEALRRYDAAEQWRFEAVQRFPNSEKAAAKFAWISQLQGRFDVALERADAAVLRFPNGTQVLTTAATIYMQDNKPDRAEQVARKALDIEPDNALANDLLGQLMAQRSYGEAELHMSAAVSLSPDSYPFVEHLAMLVRGRDPERALALFQYSLSLNLRSEDRQFAEDQIVTLRAIVGSGTPHS